MAQVLCVLPNASDCISGVRFEETPAGRLSEPISMEAAERFATIPGYQIVVRDEPPPEQAPDHSEPAPRRRGRPPTRAVVKEELS